LGQIIKGIDKIWLFGDIHTAVRFDQFLWWSNIVPLAVNG
jgi:hypothetical protein